MQLKIDEPTIGDLDLSAKKTIIEFGEVIAIGEKTLGDFKVGDKVFVKGWALDNIVYEGVNYYFVDADSQGICAKVEL